MLHEQDKQDRRISVYNPEPIQPSRRPLPIDLQSDNNHFDKVVSAIERMRKVPRGTIATDEWHQTVIAKINVVLEDIQTPTEADEAIKAVSEYNFSGTATHEELIDILLTIFGEKTDRYISEHAKKKPGISRNTLTRKEIQVLLRQSIEETIKGISEKGEQIVKKIPVQAGKEKKAFTRRAINTKKKILITEFSTILTELWFQAHIVGVLFPKQLRYIQEDGQGGYTLKNMDNAEFVAKHLEEYQYFLTHANNVLVFLEKIIKKDLNNFDQNSYLEYIGTKEKPPKTIEQIQSEIIGLYAIGGIWPYIVALEQESVYPDLMKAYKRFQKSANAHSGGYKHFILRYSQEYLGHIVKVYPGYPEENVNRLAEVRKNKKQELFANLSSHGNFGNSKIIAIAVIVLLLGTGLYFLLNHSSSTAQSAQPRNELPQNQGLPKTQDKENQGEKKEDKTQKQEETKTSKKKTSNAPTLTAPKKHKKGTEPTKIVQPKEKIIYLSGTYQYLGGALDDPKMKPYVDQIPGHDVTAKANRLYKNGNAGRRNNNKIVLKLP